MRINELASNEVAMHQEVRKAYIQVSQYIYANLEPDLDL